MLQLGEQPQSYFAILRSQWRVIFALMLRAIKTRMFGNGLGFVGFSILWPLVHMSFLLMLYYLLRRAAPVGDSATLFFATGLMPYIAFNYISRLTMLGLIFDRPLLALPIVKVTDVLLAHVLLQMLASCVTAFSLMGILWILGVDFIPRDMVQAGCALAASMLLGAGMGIINSIISLAVPFWFTGYVLILIICYATSGILFDPSKFPESIQHYLALNPVFQAVEWMRSAYYPDYGLATLDKTYLFAWGICTTCIGLALERLIRGRLINAG
jgi:capsular polysaccharide transport system permease protein